MTPEERSRLETLDTALRSNSVRDTFALLWCAFAIDWLAEKMR
jgi:hypothetical protein